MSTVAFKFRGLLAPVFTPFNNDSTQTLNLSIIPKYAKYLADKDISGVLVGGTTGEVTSLSLSEKKHLTEEWVRAVKTTKQHLMVQVGGAPLPDVVEIAKHAESLKVDSILCLPELYFKPTNVKELINYLRIISDVAPKTPLLYYHIPMYSNVNIHMGHFLENVGNKIPSFCGIKFTSNNLEEGVAAFTADNGRFSIFLGNDRLLLPACSLGMDSFIATTLNIFPEKSAIILESWKNNDIEASRRIQSQLTQIVMTISQHGKWVETMKVAMNLVTPINVGSVRPPLKLLSTEKVMTMKKDLQKILGTL